MSKLCCNDEDSETLNSWKCSFSKDETIELRKKHIAPSIQLFFAEDPIKITRGQGQYLYDENNCEYLDCINNVAHVGHSHPCVVEACTYQMSFLNTNIRFLHDNVINLASRLSKTLPSGLEVFYFVNSGSEANDLALRIGRYYTRKEDIIALDHAYHGHLLSTIGISPYKFNKPNCEEKSPSNVHVVPNPDPYRGKYRTSEYSPEQLADLYVNEVKEICEMLLQKGRSIGIFIIESIQSCGGQIVYPAGYLKKVTKLIHEYGGIVIADEVQIGFGRLGKSFWGFQLDGDDVVPDMVVIAKSMGNGYPVGAVITNKKIAEAFRRGPDYFNTYGGNPVACAVSLAVLDVIENEHLQEHAMKVGSYLKGQIMTLMTEIDVIGDVRGEGFFLGVDLVKNRITKEPASDAAKLVLIKLKIRKILLSRDGFFDNVLKIKPPMCFNQDNADTLVENLREVLKEVQYEMKLPILQ